MTVSIFDFPTIPISKCIFVPVFTTDMQTSAVSGHEYITENPGERWVIQYYFQVLTLDEAKLLKQHLSKLRGSVNKSRLFDPLFKEQSGTWGGSPVIDGAGQYGLYADVRGFSPNQVVAEALDRCVIGTQLMEISDQATADSSGRARLYFTNELRELTTDGMSITSDVSSLRCIGRWTDPSQIQQLSGNRRLYRNITVDFMEAFA
jgi:hypothetical protein